MHMSKKLDSILDKIPSATVKTTIYHNKNDTEVPKLKMVRLNANVPYDLKIQMKRYMLEHPGETEKSIIIRGLIGLGFKVSEDYLIDLRTVKS